MQWTTLPLRSILFDHLPKQFDPSTSISSTSLGHTPFHSSITLIMDGDQLAKTMEEGANKAMQGSDMTSGIHETVNQTVRGQA